MITVKEFNERRNITNNITFTEKANEILEYIHTELLQVLDDGCKGGMIVGSIFNFEPSWFKYTHLEAFKLAMESLRSAGYEARLDTEDGAHAIILTVPTT